MDDLLTVKEMAQKLKLSSQTLYKMVRQGEIPGVKVGNQWRFDPSQVHTWLTTKNGSEAPTESRKAAKVG